MHQYEFKLHECSLIFYLVNHASLTEDPIFQDYFPLNIAGFEESLIQVFCFRVLLM
jgi:hypothetical protein